MKKTIFVSALMLMTLLGGCVTTTTSVSASSSMSTNKLRDHARFITDRMAYELDLSPMQYGDCYEINYDFIYYASGVMEDVAHGYYDAINTYYRYLDYRNEDLRYVLNTAQYIKFLSREYFYRPIYTSGSSWNFRIYTIYSNRSFYYYDAPVMYKTYRGGHSRHYYTNSFYTNRYDSKNRYTGNPRITGSSTFNDSRRNDFGTNLRNRDQKPDYNNYNNRNSSNRTADPRYRDNSGNTRSPEINNRTTSSGEHRGQNQTTSQSRNQYNNNGSSQGRGRSQTNSQTNSQTRSQTQSQTNTQTGTRSENQTPTTGTRGTRTTSGRR